MDKDLSVRPETLKILKENIGGMIFDISFSSIFFIFWICLLRQGKQKQKQTNGLHQTKKLLHMKETINKSKICLLNGRR